MGSGPVTDAGSGRDPAHAPSAAAPGAPELVQRFKRWHARLRQSSPPAVDPLLRMQRGAALIRGARARRIDDGLLVLLGLAGGGLEPPPPDFEGRSLRPKVVLEVRAEGAGLRIGVGYYGRVPGVRALATARASLGDAAYLHVEGGAGQSVRLVLLLSEPPRSLSVVVVDAGARRLAVPMHFVTRALPHVPVEGEGGAGSTTDPSTEHSPDAGGEPVASMAARLGLVPAPSSLGRPALLVMEFSDGEMMLWVDAVLGHRQSLVHGTGPLLGAIPWLLGVIEGEDGEPVLVVHPRRLPSIPSR